MEKDLVYGDRLLSVNVLDDDSKKFVRRFLKLVRRFEKEIHELMDDYEIPNEVLLNFQLGDGELEGFYHVSKKDVAENVVAIEFFTRPFVEVFAGDKAMTDYELLDTFVHELIHNKYKSEKTTRRKAKEFMSGIENKLAKI